MVCVVVLFFSLYWRVSFIYEYLRRVIMVMTHNGCVSRHLKSKSTPKNNLLLIEAEKSDKLSKKFGQNQITNNKKVMNL